MVSAVCGLESDSEALIALQNYLSEELQSNNKAVTYYSVSERWEASVWDVLNRLEVDRSIPFPCVLDSARLQGLSQYYEVVSRESSDNKVKISLTRRKIITLRKKIEEDFSRKAPGRNCLFLMKYMA